MSSIWQKAFWQAAAERAIKSAAQAMVLVLAADIGFNVLTVDWQETLGVGAGGAVLSILTSIISSGFGPGDGPSLTGAEQLSGPV